MTTVHVALRRAPAGALASTLGLLSMLSCGDGARADAGRDAAMTVAGGTFVRGAPPEEASGPAVVSVNLGTDTATAGELAKPVRGAMGASATALSLQLRGDRGYWIVRAREPQIDAPSLPSFLTTLGFTKLLAAGDYDLVARAVAPGGTFGPPLVRTLHIARTAPPEGRLVVTLTWANDADLDLHVVDPNGVEIWKGNINSYAPPAPGEPVDPRAWENGGILDTDSNAKCVIDAKGTESVTWKGVPPTGHYAVRVDTFSMCSASSAPWRVEVRLDGAVVSRAAGQSTGWDATFGHDIGAGVSATEFDVP